MPAEQRTTLLSSTTRTLGGVAYGIFVGVCYGAYGAFRGLTWYVVAVRDRLLRSGRER